MYVYKRSIKNISLFLYDEKKIDCNLKRARSANERNGGTFMCDSGWYTKKLTKRRRKNRIYIDII